MGLEAVMVLVVVLTLVGTGTCVQAKTTTCYKCTNCDDPFDPKSTSAVMVNCSGSCMKEVSKVTIMKDQLQTDRGCHNRQASTDSCEEDEKGITSTLTCICTTDLCNSARTLRPARAVVEAVSFVLVTLVALQVV